MKHIDIVESCRMSSPNDGSADLFARCLSAADEIERLRDDAVLRHEDYVTQTKCIAAQHAELALLRDALTRITSTYDAYRRRGVAMAPSEYADVVRAIERARQELASP